MRKLIFGFGYLGSRVGRLWREEGHEVTAVTRSEERAARLVEEGYRAVVADVVRPETLRDLPEADTVLFAVGFDRTAGETITRVYVDGLRNVLAALPGEPQRFIYTSSTGVYGPGDGGWIDEESPCRPDREGGRACLAAEQLLRDSRFQDRAIILRLAGVYGPGRIPRAADLLAGRPLAVPAESHLNLIHVDDAAKIIVQADQLAAAPRTLLVCDGQPVLRQVYFAYLASLLGAPPPAFAPAQAQEPPPRGTSDRRASNARLMSELRPELRYPSYREGLAAILAGDAESNG